MAPVPEQQSASLLEPLYGPNPVGRQQVPSARWPPSQQSVVATACVTSVLVLTFGLSVLPVATDALQAQAPAVRALLQHSASFAAFAPASLQQ